MYVRALLLRNCGRFTHVQSDFGSQYHTHMFVTSHALYASLTRGVTWRHSSRFVDLDDDAEKPGRADYFFCDYDVKAKPLWFTPGIFVDEQLRFLSKNRHNVDRSDFNVIDEGYPGTGAGGRPYYVPTYGSIEAVLPNQRLLTFGLSTIPAELETFSAAQTFLMGKKRAMFQVIHVSEVAELRRLDGFTAVSECHPIQVKPSEVANFSEYEIIAGTSRYLLLRGQTFGGSQLAVISFGMEGPSLTRAIPSFWVDRVIEMLS